MQQRMVTYDTGATNYQNGGVPDVYAAYEDAFVSGGDYLAVGRQDYLASRMPANDTLDFDGTGLVAGAFTSDGNAGNVHAPEGDYYYGFLGGPLPPTPPIATYSPLVSNDLGYFGEYPLELQPIVHEPPPWMRADAYDY